MHSGIGPFHVFRAPADDPLGSKPTATEEGESKFQASGSENFILCRQCTQVITSRHESISVNGSHRHSFANPHGFIFDIACFRSVTGCGYAGSPSSEFTWFPGYSWRIALCGMCLTHLGWKFLAESGTTFHALISNRIIEASPDQKV